MESNELSVLDTKLLENNIFELISPIVQSDSQENTEAGESTAQIEDGNNAVFTRELLSSKKAIELLLNGTLRAKVCRYCLNVTSPLSDLDEVLQIANYGTLYKVSIREMIASFHPIKVADDYNFPNKICDKCVKSTLKSYLFTQQCEQSERALRNYFEDIYNKLEKLDPVERQRKRGRKKLHYNPNVLVTEHKHVIDYAEPLITIVNIGCTLLDSETKDPYTCSKCLEVMPTIESKINHENSHPKSMWYHCRHCGKSFPKYHLLKKHLQGSHNNNKLATKNTDFICKECGFVNEDYHQHLQHVEKHKFQVIVHHLITRRMNKLCSICLNKGSKLSALEKRICFHGGYPEIMGDRTVYSILKSSIPDMNFPHNLVGTKICEKCLNHAIVSYVFKQQTLYIMNRLKSCLNHMLEQLDTVQSPKGNIFVEISQHLIMPIKEEYFDDNDSFIDDEEDLDEAKLNVEVLEDEFRIESGSDDSTSESENKKLSNDLDLDEIVTNGKNRDTTNNKLVINHQKSKLINGIHPSKKSMFVTDVCSEFLTFNKRKKQKRKVYKCKFTCPICSKHFVSEYFFTKHVIKHSTKKSACFLCNITFESKFHVYEHTRMMHLLKNTKYFSCKICGRSFVDQLKLSLHEKSHNMKICQLCDKAFVSQKYFDSHIQRHLAKIKMLREKTLLNCNFCERVMISDNELSIHVNKMHFQIKPYSCDMCERQFYTETNLNSHKICHSLKHKEVCFLCKKILKCRRDLVVHIRKHIGSRPYVCQVCPQSFYSQNKLKKHMKLIHGDRFCCKLCKANFSSSYCLNEHVRKVHNISSLTNLLGG